MSKLRYTSKEMGRTAEEGSGDASDTCFGKILLDAAREVYGEDFDFSKCTIRKGSDATVVVFDV